MYVNPPSKANIHPTLPHRHLETSIQRQQFRASSPPFGGQWGNRRGGLFAPTATAALALRRRAQGGQGRGADMPSDEEDEEELEGGVLAAESMTLEGLRRRGDYSEEMVYDSELDGSSD